MDNRFFLIPVPDYIIAESGVNLADITEVFAEEGMVIIRNPVPESIDECGYSDHRCGNNHESCCRHCCERKRG